MKNLESIEIVRERERERESLLSKPKGITLIALVVTIVVLLILAGITINLLFSNGGIFDVANQAKIEHEIGALKDRINNVIADWYIDKGIDSTTTSDDLWDKMVDADIIDNPDEDVAGPEKEGENDRYELTTNKGYIVEIIISPDGNVSIGDIEKGDSLPPKIGEITSTSNSNSIHIEVEITSSEGEVRLSYYYKKDGELESSYQKLKEGVTELTADFTGLEQNVVYNIKVVVEDDNGTAEKVINVTTGELTGAVTQKGETVWSEGTATIELETKEEGVTIQYQIDDTEGEWLDYEGPITGLNHGETVYAVITDGTNQSGHTSIDILDEIAPTVTVTQGNITTNSIEVTVTVTEEQWGMAEDTTYNYYLKKISDTEYSEEPTYTGTETTHNFSNLLQNTSYDVKVTVQDKAENLGEGEVTNITTGTVGGGSDGLKEGNIIASEPTWNGGQASITLSKGSGVDSNLTIQYQVGGVAEGNWTTAVAGAASTTVTGLSHNSEVYARLTDGVNFGGYASVTILDTINPQKATITLSTNNTLTGTTITATVTHIDNESGVNVNQSKWIYNTKSGAIGTNAGSYTNYFSGNGQTINLNASTAGTYYLHVLTVDNAGRVIETISDPVTVVAPNVAPTTPTVNYSSKTTSSITVTARATDANNDKLTYRLYVSTSQSSGFTQAATSSATTSGSTVTLTASNLSEYTYYYYYVTVTDGTLTTTGTTSTAVRTYCPGNTNYCSGGEYSTTNCTTCHGSGKITVCAQCGQPSRANMDCIVCGSSRKKNESCTVCNGTGDISTFEECKHGYSSSHYYCSHSYSGSQHD